MNMLCTILLMYMTVILVPVHQADSLAIPSGNSRRSFSSRSKPRNQEAVTRRQSGIKPKRRKRTPRWEVEGDLLYQEIITDNNNSNNNSNNKTKITMEDAHHILAKLATTPPPRVRRPPKKGGAETERKKVAPSHTVWGTLPVGPILKTRLTSSRHMPEPTDIQTAAFPIISKGLNCVVASPTGTGKTLAYLVPLVATKNRNVACGTIIVTPTVELALQISREVDILWPPANDGNDDDDNGKSSLAVHVVGATRQDDDAPLLVRGIDQAAIIAGTPRMLRTLFAEARDHAAPDATEEQRQRRRNFRTATSQNLKTIVLDEADRLLRTEGVARDQNQGSTKNKRKAKPTQTEQLLRQSLLLPSRLDDCQVICASATVGRTLRRQLMSLLQTSSIDKAAELVTADARATAKDVDKRKTTLVPETLTHAYVLVHDENDQNTKQDSQTTTLNVLCDYMLNMVDPAPTLIFPGRLGVRTVQERLTESLGLEHVMSLKDVGSTTGMLASSVSNYNEWKKTPVFVVPDKFARGLDLPNICHVILLSPPSSAAGYMHLSGRTGRNGLAGKVTTLLRPRDVPRLVTIAERLGLPFVNGARDEEAVATPTDEPAAAIAAEDSMICDEEPSKTDCWSSLSESTLMRKKASELGAYLEDKGLSAANSEGKTMRKVDMVKAIQNQKDRQQ